MQSQQWGEASSYPPHVDESICSIPMKPGFQLLNNSSLVDTSDGSLYRPGDILSAYQPINFTRGFSTLVMNESDTTQGEVD